MMKSGRLFILAFLACMLVSTANAASVSEQNIIVDIMEDGSTRWQVELSYDNLTEKSDFLIVAYIKNVEIYGSQGRLDCDVLEEGIGTLIACDKIQEKSVTYTFDAYNLVRNIGSSKMFSYSFPVTGIVGEFGIVVNLPLGAGIVQADKIQLPGLKPFTPENGTEGTDGRQIFVKWFFVKPQLGQTIPVSVMYEQIFGPTQIFMAVIALVIILPVAFLVLAMRRRGRIEQVLPILNENERKIMKIILEERGDVDQRKIVKECDMSKSKVSRILKDLEHRGLIVLVKKGRSNKIRLVYEGRRKEQKTPEEKAEKKKDEKKFYQEQK